MGRIEVYIRLSERGREFRMRLKKTLGYVLFITVLLCCACGADKQKEGNLEGSLGDIVDGIYESADLSEDFRAGLENFETYELTEDMEVSLLGTDEISYTEGIASIPMISPNAFQLVLLRVEEEDVDTVKQQLKDNADLNKWICVSAETMLVESRGDVIFFVMGDNDTVYALNSAFQKY